MKNFLFKLFENLTAIVILFSAWLIFAGNLQLAVIIVGLIITSLVVIIFPEIQIKIFSPYIFKRGVFIIVFLFYLLLEVFQASFKLALFILHPSYSLRSSIITYDYQLSSNIAILFLSVVITLTPGTLVLDINENKNSLYIHYLDHVAGEKAKAFETIELMEKWLRRIFE